MKEREKMVALTGHRVCEHLDEDALQYELESLIREGYTGFLCGMAQGFDLTALKYLVALKCRYSLYIEACIPFEGHERSIPKAFREQYQDLLSACDKRTVMLPGFSEGGYFTRDRYMVDCADLVLAHLEKEEGGTAYTVSYAKQKGVPVRFI